MELKFEKKGATLVVKMKGELDHHFSEDARNKIEKELNRSHCKNILLDFQDVGFMDSSGIGMVIGRYKYVSALGGKLAVLHVGESMDKIFQAAGLYRIISQYASIEEARKEGFFA